MECIDKREYIRKAIGIEKNIYIKVIGTRADYMNISYNLTKIIKEDDQCTETNILLKEIEKQILI